MKNILIPGIIQQNKNDIIGKNSSEYYGGQKVVKRKSIPLIYCSKPKVGVKCLEKSSPVLTKSKANTLTSTFFSKEGFGYLKKDNKIRNFPEDGSMKHFKVSNLGSFTLASFRDHRNKLAINQDLDLALKKENVNNSQHVLDKKYAKISKCSPPTNQVHHALFRATGATNPGPTQIIPIHRKNDKNDSATSSTKTFVRSECFHHNNVSSNGNGCNVLFPPQCTSNAFISSKSSLTSKNKILKEESQIKAPPGLSCCSLHERERKWHVANKSKVSTLKVRSVFSSIRWHINSTCRAVTEYSLSGIGKLCSSRNKPVISPQTTKVKPKFKDFTAMAERKILALKKSISSWSLSNVSKPNLYLSKKRNFRLKLFSNKNRKSKEHVHSDGPNDATSSDKSKSTFYDSKFTSSFSLEDLNDGVRSHSSQKIYALKGTEIGEDYEDTSFKSTLPAEISYKENFPYESEYFRDPETDLVFCSCQHSLNDMTSPRYFKNDENYSYYDAQEESTSEKNLFVLYNSKKKDYVDDDNYEFYDVADSAIPTPTSFKSFDEKMSSPILEPISGSAKAREWVKSYEEISDRSESSLATPCSSTSSRSCTSEALVQESNYVHKEYTTSIRCRRDKETELATHDRDTMDGTNSNNIDDNGFHWKTVNGFCDSNLVSHPPKHTDADSSPTYCPYKLSKSKEAQNCQDNFMNGRNLSCNSNNIHANKHTEHENSKTVCSTVFNTDFTLACQSTQNGNAAISPEQAFCEDDSCSSEQNNSLKGKNNKGKNSSKMKFSLKNIFSNEAKIKWKFGKSPKVAKQHAHSVVNKNNNISEDHSDSSKDMYNMNAERSQKDNFEIKMPQKINETPTKGHHCNEFSNFSTYEVGRKNLECNIGQNSRKQLSIPREVPIQVSSNRVHNCMFKSNPRHEREDSNSCSGKVHSNQFDVLDFRAKQSLHSSLGSDTHLKAIELKNNLSNKGLVNVSCKNKTLKNSDEYRQQSQKEENEKKILSQEDLHLKNQPVPAPRRKKGIYGYFANRNSSLTPNINNTKLSLIDELNEETRDYTEKENHIAVNGEISSKPADCYSKKIIMRETNCMAEVPAISIESTLGDSVQDHIYWEITDSSQPIKPRARKKRKYLMPFGAEIINRKQSSLSDLPEWIQQRPPIPSPRIKKLHSTQSLNPVIFSNFSEKSPYDTEFCCSPTNINYAQENYKYNMNQNDGFYSGKAASVSYGRTNHSSSPQTQVKSSMNRCFNSFPEITSNQNKLQFNTDLKWNSINDCTTSPFRRTPRQRSKRFSFPQQLFEYHLRQLTDRVTSTEIARRGYFSPVEGLATEVLFALLCIMGQNADSKWTVISDGPRREERKKQDITLGQIKMYMQEVFQLPTERLSEIEDKIHRRESSKLLLSLTVKEANNLRAKTVRGGSNPFVIAHTSGSIDSCRTRTEHETLRPKWNQHFEIKIRNITQDYLKLDVWHEAEPNRSTDVSAVKDIRGFSRLMKETTTAFVHKQEPHLLGTTKVPLSDIGEKGIEETLLLVKDHDKEIRKERGSLLIEAYIISSCQNISPVQARRNQEALLAKLIYHSIKSESNNNKEDNFNLPWNGKLGPEALALLAQHAITFGLKPHVQRLSWWIVGSRVPSVDFHWLLERLKVLQRYLAVGLYDIMDLEDFAESLSLWVDFSLHKLRNLDQYFPSSSGIIAKHKLCSLLSILKLINKNEQTKDLLNKKEIGDLQVRVEESVMAFAKLWWKNLVDEHLKDDLKPEMHLQKVIVISEQSYNFLCDVAGFYSPILLKESNIPYFREIYLMITKKLSACVRPSLMSVYNNFEYATKVPMKEVELSKGQTRNIPVFSFEDGTLLWQMYITLGRISRIGNEFPLDIRQDSGIYEYHKWFNKGVRRWVELARQRALLMIEKAVVLDDLEPVDKYCNFSSSATDVLSIFIDVEIWWRKLEWPDPENSMILLAKILEDVCSYALRYADLLKEKVERMFTYQRNAEQLELSKQICTGLNNIEKIRDNVLQLPLLFNMQDLLMKIENTVTAGENVSEKFERNINSLVESSSECLEEKVIDFIEAVLSKMSPGLQAAVIEACEISSGKPLLNDMLDPALQLLKEKLSDRNFRRFLERLWESVLTLIHRTVSQNAGKRKPSFFEGVYYVLIACLSCFAPCDGAGIPLEEAKRQEYTILLELLECLRLSSESLISKYYSERLEEQNLLTNSAKGQLVVRTFFTKEKILKVEIIMARDIQVNSDASSMASKGSQHSFHSGHSVDSYVSVQLVPNQWFPKVQTNKTKVMRNSDPAVFEETFSLDASSGDDVLSCGFLLLSLKNYNLGRSNTFIGEALIPLSKIPCVDVSQAHTVQNTYLKITQPGIECGYQSIRALKLRPSDKVATLFVKKIHSRLSKGKQRPSVVSSGKNGLTSDDEKSRPTSPARFLQKLKLS